MKQAPLLKLQDGLITATIWLNKTDEGLDRYSISLVRNYQKDEKWHETSSYGPLELLKIARLSEAAYDFVRQHRQAEAISDRVT